mmetsp:Transcript_23040/g.22421  ORF Transcript_23040/g.22421 Transcript_23040/m.22421 type:complete len:401 (+) Transcript_23040:1196-2398(+)
MRNKGVDEDELFEEEVAVGDAGGGGADGVEDAAHPEAALRVRQIDLQRLLLQMESHTSHDPSQVDELHKHLVSLDQIGVTEDLGLWVQQGTIFPLGTGHSLLERLRRGWDLEAVWGDEDGGEFGDELHVVVDDGGVDLDDELLDGELERPQPPHLRTRLLLPQALRQANIELNEGSGVSILGADEVFALLLALLHAGLPRVHLLALFLRLFLRPFLTGVLFEGLLGGEDDRHAGAGHVVQLEVVHLEPERGQRLNHSCPISSRLPPQSEVDVHVVDGEEEELLGLVVDDAHSKALEHQVHPQHRTLLPLQQLLQVRRLALKVPFPLFLILYIGNAELLGVPGDPHVHLVAAAVLCLNDLQLLSLLHVDHLCDTFDLDHELLDGLDPILPGVRDLSLRIYV